MTTKSKKTTTFEREMRDRNFKKTFEKEYREFALKELLAAMAAGDNKSVRALAKDAGLHPNAIQNIKSGKTSDMKMTSFLKIANAYGFALQLVKGKVHISINFTGDEFSYQMAG